MIVTCSEGHVYDDAQKSTICPHYPIHAGPGAYCKSCDLWRPCVACGETMGQLPEQSPRDAERYPIEA